MYFSLIDTLPRDLDYEIIFADDFSSDGTRAWLSRLNSPNIQVILNAENQGYAKTNNLAVAHATGTYIGLLNNDLVLTPGWFEPMLAALETKSLNAGILGNLQYRVVDKVLDHAGVVLTPRGQFDHARVEPIDQVEPISVYAATGACMLMRKMDFDEVGGFDEVFLNGSEDIDLCMKIKAAGKKIYVAPDSQILHHVSLSRDRTTLQNEKNSIHLFSKWRKEIKLQLSRNWIRLLAEGANHYQPHIDGVFTPSAMAQPHITAIAVADSALNRESARWAKDLDISTTGDKWQKHITVSGVTFNPKVNAYLAGSSLNIEIDHLKTACNFYVCGRVIAGFTPATIHVTISVNGLQSKTVQLTDSVNFNVGIVEPLIISGLSNCFTVEVFTANNFGQERILIDGALLITHFVVNDQVVKNFNMSLLTP
jgi:GT2 family glycosyltransferase